MGNALLTVDQDNFEDCQSILRGEVDPSHSETVECDWSEDGVSRFTTENTYQIGKTLYKARIVTEESYGEYFVRNVSISKR